MVQLVVPSQIHLASYMDALQRGWSPNTARPQAAAREELAAIEVDADAFLASMDDMDAKGAPVTMPDGSTVPRLPGFRRWIWDGELAGSIAFRWQPGTVELPPYCLGHIGYAVVPWKQRKGYATAALRLLLQEVRRLGLPYVEITADPDNLASQKVILAVGGQLHERFNKPAQFGGEPGLRYRVALA